ncbi:MAG: NAD(P)/FAD-dependent oxidoreductase [Alphaproteobacteria bacterium]|nr:NAD(P)/FAD-dependent oxidoreductase [Alphaproteobacteria bacterium]
MNDALELPERCDVLICGAGLAGLTLALQLRQELPDREVVLVEKTCRPLPAGAHKVGESSVELASQYFERLGLRDYLHTHHLLKFGLRIFAGDGDRPLQERAECGPGAEPFLNAYQIDRGRFESDLRDKVVEAGATLIEGAKVGAVRLGAGDAPHEVEVRQGEARRTLRATWLVDATGRAALLRKQLGTRRPSPHHASAAWLRVSGRVDVNDWVTDPDSAFRQQPTAGDRWRSTNHFMGVGYWFWVIPLAGDRTSLGLVMHEAHHDFSRIRDWERLKGFLREHEPHVLAHLEAHLAAGHEVLDFHCLKEFSHDVAQSWSPDRWAIVGEAGTFVDPLYAPGSDFIALANTLTVELMRGDQEGVDLSARCAELERDYRAIFEGALDFFREVGPVYGYAPAMTAKMFWDNYFYWSFHCQWFQQRIYRERGASLAAFHALGQRWFALNRQAQALLRRWALLATAPAVPGFLPLPNFPSLQVEAIAALLNELTPEDTLEFMEECLGRARALLAEMALRACLELGPEGARALVEATGLDSWSLPLSPERLALEAGSPEARAQALPPLARELDACLHPHQPHPQAAQVLPLLGA